MHPSPSLVPRNHRRRPQEMESVPPKPRCLQGNVAVALPADCLLGTVHEKEFGSREGGASTLEANSKRSFQTSRTQPVWKRRKRERRWCGSPGATWKPTRRRRRKEAAEMLRAGPPRRPESHPLADYHYTGSDTWTPVEEQLFKEAFYLHKKNFRLIQKQIQTKSVSQCVEYYYTWKKKTRFGCTRPRLTQKKRPRRPEEEEEALCSAKKRQRIIPKENPKLGSQEENPCNGSSSSINAGASWCWDGGAGDPGFFPCGECGRVFEKIQGRNAHMRFHRPNADV
ncbi:zinc finger protein 541-like [Larus michahellis]|uniref:zinc finger protein 541-like n=1 Tax=Larus michahellis TaxID=119627 RepID=UPI003D9B33E4